jgi:hypothetical protein
MCTILEVKPPTNCSEGSWKHAGKVIRAGVRLFINAAFEAFFPEIFLKS